MAAATAASQTQAKTFALTAVKGQSFEEDVHPAVVT
jgi:hypothetical protein